jgi:hypothetical protein
MDGQIDPKATIYSCDHIFGPYDHPEGLAGLFEGVGGNVPDGH